MFCEKCGEKLKENSLFCENCGVEIKREQKTVNEIIPKKEKANFLQKNWSRLAVMILVTITVFSFAYYLNKKNKFDSKNNNINDNANLESNQNSSETQETVKEGYKVVNVNNPKISFFFQVPSDWGVETRNSGEKKLSPEEIRNFLLTGKKTILNGEVYIEGKDLMKNDVLKWNDAQLTKFMDDEKDAFATASVAKDYISYVDWNSTQIDFNVKNNLDDKKYIDEQKKYCTQKEGCEWENKTIANYPAQVASYSGEDPNYGGTTKEYTGGKTYFIDTGNDILIINKQGVDDENYEKDFSNLIETLEIIPNENNNNKSGESRYQEILKRAKGQKQAPLDDIDTLQKQQKKCNQDGLKFFEDYKTKNFPYYYPLFDKPIYYFNKQLNTCLASISYKDSTHVYLGKTVYDISHDEVTDIYSNKTLISTDSSNEDTDFQQQKKVLMSE